MAEFDTTIWNLPTLPGTLDDTARIPVSIGDALDDTFYFTPLDMSTFLEGFFLPAGPQIADLDMDSHLINNVTDPVSNQDAATKFYVDTIATALDWKTPVVVATTGNIGLANIQTIDGVLLVATNRVLVKDQTDNTQNGIYSVVDGADWTRTTDADTPTELEHATVFTEKGTTNNGKAYTQIADIITIGVSPIIWMEIFQITPVTAGAGLSFTGTILNVGGTTGKIVVNADNVDVGSDVVTIDDTHTYDAGLKQIFTPDSSTNPGINIGTVVTIDPSSVVDADMWYNSAADAFRGGRADGVDTFVMVDQVQTITGVKTFGTTSNVGKLKLAGTTSGIITLDAFEEAGTNTLTLPAITDTIVTRGNIESLTNKTFIEVERSDGANADFVARVHNNSVDIRGVFGAAKSRGTESIPLALLLGDDIGGLEGAGHDGTSFSLSGEIIFKASENWTVDDHGTEIEFLTTPNNTITPTPQLLIGNDGTVNFLSNNITGIGTLNSHTIPGGTDTFAMLAATQTLTNKTIDGDDNTIQDINETQLTVLTGVSGTVLTSSGVGVAPSYQTIEFFGPWTATHDAGGQTLDNLGVLISNDSDPATVGVIRLGNGEAIAWRNNAGDDNGFRFTFTSADRGQFLFPSGASYGFAETFIALNGADLSTAKNILLNSDDTHILEFQQGVGGQSLPYLIGETQWMYENSLSVIRNYAKIKGSVVDDTAAGSEEGKITFEVMTGSVANVEILEINGAGLDVNSHFISSVLDPVSLQDAATKNYVDSLISSSLGNMEVNLISASPAVSLNINSINTYVAYGTTNWVEPTTNVDFSSTTGGIMTYNGTTRSFKVDLWNNVSDSTGTGVQNEFVTGVFVNATLYSPSEMRCGRNGGGIARSFVIELNNADVLDIRSKNVGSAVNGEYTNVGIILTPLPITV